MKKNYLEIVLSSLIIVVVGVYIIDYFSHLLFSNPMETLPYFMAKATLYFVFSILFFSLVDTSQKEFTKVAIAGVIVASLWGIYYNILPAILNYYPFGIPLRGLTFLGMGLLGTGVAFGVVHVLAFVGGYCSAKAIFGLFKSSTIK
jgi:hypothetical protein